MSMKWPGGLIRKTPVTPAGPLQNGAAPGMWTMAEAAYWKKQGLWPTAGNFLAVEDVFSTYLYTGNGSTQTITNGINLSGQGGLVWVKARGDLSPLGLTGSHTLYDTNRGASNALRTNGTFASASISGVTAFNSNGFDLGTNGVNNASGYTYVSWTFREAPKFFDVVTFTANSSGGATFSHSLGGTPGCIMFKRTSGAQSWYVYHRSIPTSLIFLDLTNAAQNAGTWVTTTSTSVTVVDGNLTANENYVAYLFAHDTASDGIIQCGSFTTDGSGLGTATLGWEPQWLICRSVGVDNWWMVDNMRGWVTGSAYNTSDDRAFIANGSNAEFTSGQGFATSTGFVFNGALSAQHIYIAIRRGPMRTPTSGTSVFAPITWSGTGTNNRVITGAPTASDSILINTRNQATNYWNWNDRLRSAQNTLYPYTTSAENAGAGATYGVSSINMDGFTQGSQDGLSGGYNASGATAFAYFFKRAPSFFDVVCYTGTGAARTINHNLGVAPELMIVKRRDSSGNWLVYSAATGATKSLFLNFTDPSATFSYWNNTSPTASVFSIGTTVDGNGSGGTYVAYLFASCPGVSKIGTYTGNGSSQTINCGFTTGARFVLIKRTDSTGSWYVWDSARGISSGNDPYLLLNNTAAEVTGTNYVDTTSVGFQVTAAAPAELNANGGTYIFLAVA